MNGVPSDVSVCAFHHSLFYIYSAIQVYLALSRFHLYTGGFPSSASFTFRFLPLPCTRKNNPNILLRLSDYQAE